MIYVPSKRDVLEGHYQPPGMPVFLTSVCEDLEAERFLKKTEHEVSPISPCWALTEKGTALVEFLRGERNSLHFTVPDWVLEEVTRP